MRNYLANATVGTVGVIGALKLPEIAATAAGFSTAIWMLVQTILAIRRAREADKCTVEGCQKRKQPSSTL
jgi:hypothetical protein